MGSVIKYFWRDVVAILTIILILGSLFLIAYGIGRTNATAEASQEQIQCIAKFFGEKDRAAARITNVEDCRIVR